MRTLGRTVGGPPEDNAPLVVDADRVPPLQGAPERFQAIAWGRPQVLQVEGGVQHV